MPSVRPCAVRVSGRFLARGGSVHGRFGVPLRFGVHGRFGARGPARPCGPGPTRAAPEPGRPCGSVLPVAPLGPASLGAVRCGPRRSYVAGPMRGCAGRAGSCGLAPDRAGMSARPGQVVSRDAPPSSVPHGRRTLRLPPPCRTAPVSCRVWPGVPPGAGAGAAPATAAPPAAPASSARGRQTPGGPQAWVRCDFVPSRPTRTCPTGPAALRSPRPPARAEARVHRQASAGHIAGRHGVWREAPAHHRGGGGRAYRQAGRMFCRAVRGVTPGGARTYSRVRELPGGAGACRRTSQAVYRAVAKGAAGCAESSGRRPGLPTCRTGRAIGGQRRAHRRAVRGVPPGSAGPATGQCGAYRRAMSGVLMGRAAPAAG